MGEPIFNGNGTLPWLCMKEVGGMRLRSHQTLPRWCYRSSKKHWERRGLVELLGGEPLDRQQAMQENSGASAFPSRHPSGDGLVVMQLHLRPPCPVCNQSPNNNNTKKTQLITPRKLIGLPVGFGRIVTLVCYVLSFWRCMCCVCLGKSHTMQAA